MKHSLIQWTLKQKRAVKKCLSQSQIVKVHMHRMHWNTLVQKLLETHSWRELQFVKVALTQPYNKQYIKKWNNSQSFETRLREWFIKQKCASIMLPNQWSKVCQPPIGWKENITCIIELNKFNCYSIKFIKSELYRKVTFSLIQHILQIQTGIQKSS